MPRANRSGRMADPPDQKRDRRIRRVKFTAATGALGPSSRALVGPPWLPVRTFLHRPWRVSGREPAPTTPSSVCAWRAQRRISRLPGLLGELPFAHQPARRCGARPDQIGEGVPSLRSIQNATGTR